MLRHVRDIRPHQVLADHRMTKLKSALQILDRFDQGQFTAPTDAESLLVQIFEACGYSAIRQGFVDSGRTRYEIDCFIQVEIDGVSQLIAAEVAAGARPAGIEAVDRAHELKSQGPFHRSIIISRLGFSDQALRHADTVGLGRFDLLSPHDLRVWLSKQVEPEEINGAYERIIRGAMRKLAEVVARDPSQLASLEWRDLEKVLREVFERIGFETRLTRPGKDGGFDLELTVRESGEMQVYLVEVKHWSEQKPGIGHVRKFVEVATSRQANAGLLLSTSGFTKPVYSGITEFDTSIHLGEGNKIVSLCKTYYRLQSALWIEDKSLQETLLSETRAFGHIKC